MDPAGHITQHVPAYRNVHNITVHDTEHVKCNVMVRREGDRAACLCVGGGGGREGKMEQTCPLICLLGCLALTASRTELDRI